MIPLAAAELNTKFLSSCFSAIRSSDSSSHSAKRPISIRSSTVNVSAASVIDECVEEKKPASSNGLKSSGLCGRRSAIASGLSLLCAVLGFEEDASAVVKQGLLAGRIPGLSGPDERGWRTYRRPDEKSGGHGVGWSPIIPYTFSVPPNWEEVPVSIADLGGTEIDLRFANPQEGRLFVVVAPVLRFADLGEDAKIEDIGPPEKVINAFGPEITGENVEGKVLSMAVTEHVGRKYYHYELEPPHVLISATAAGNRLYMFGITGSGLQWKRHYKDLKEISSSFRVT
ncbi:PsbP domain-containing protein 4 [Nymphaea thermarum]|nr:PsbP domain-containing protein 4 [Nymphaea thermarum]